MNRVFIIGAGASSEVDFPLGSGLLKEIGLLLNFKYKTYGLDDLISGDYDIYHTLKKLCKSEGEFSVDNFELENSALDVYLESGVKIHEVATFHRSIDNLINQNKENKQLEIVAKLAIVKSILKHEQKFVKTYHLPGEKNKIDFSKLEQTWFHRFNTNLFERADINQLRKRLAKTTFIIFNYDRCFEHILYEAIKLCYGLSDSETSLITSELDIYHPYGSLGKLAKMEFDMAAIERNYLDFGSDVSPSQLINAIGKIRTFTEGTDPKDSQIDDIRLKLKKAQKVVFLGFGFESLNMDLLRYNGNIEVNSPTFFRKSYATIKGITSNNMNYILNKIKNLFEPNNSLKTADLKCVNFFDEFSEGLSYLND